MVFRMFNLSVFDIESDLRPGVDRISRHGNQTALSPKSEGPSRLGYILNCRKSFILIASRKFLSCEVDLPSLLSSTR